MLYYHYICSSSFKHLTKNDVHVVMVLLEEVQIFLKVGKAHVHQRDQVVMHLLVFLIVHFLNVFDLSLFSFV